MTFKLPLWTLIPAFFVGGGFIFLVYQSRTPPMSLGYFLTWFVLCSGAVMVVSFFGSRKKPEQEENVKV